MPLYPSKDDVLDIHDDTLTAFGGAPGLRDEAALDRALARPKQSFEDEEFFPDDITKAAALFESLINGHPFVDGNKRTACAVLFAFLAVNGHELDVDDDELEAFALRVAGGRPTVDAVADWIRDHVDAPA